MIAALHRCHRAGIALTTALMMPAVLIVVALVVDTGFYVIGQTRLQMAADAASMSSLLMMQNPTFQVATTTQQQQYLNAVALADATTAASKLIGTISVTATPTGYKKMTIVATASPIATMTGLVPGATVPTFTATSVASMPSSSPCMLALGPGVTQTDNSGGTVGILVENGTTVTSSGCSIWSNTSTSSNTVYSIDLLSGASITSTGTGAGIGANGNFSTTSGTTFSPAASPGANQGTVTDPFASYTAPTDPGTCTYTSTNGSYLQTAQTYTTSTATPTTFCADSTHTWAWKPAAGKTVSFGPGIYYFINSNAQFVAAPGTFTFDTTSGVTFVFLARGAVGTAISGSLNWALDSRTWMPYSGATFGTSTKFAFVQPCNANTNTATNGSAIAPKPMTVTVGVMTVNDAIYLPCSELEVSGSGGLWAPTSGSSLNLGIVAAAIHATQTSTGNTAIKAHGTSTGGTGTTAALTQ
jgi:hypothetical protein